MANNGEFRSPCQNYDDGTCAICLRSHINKSTPNCGHVFCFRCLIDWCQIKLECPTCKQPFQNFRHNIQIRPTGDQIYTPAPPLAPVDDFSVAEMSMTVVNEDHRNRQSWVIRSANRMIVIPMPVSSHDRLNDPGFRLRFFAFLNRQFDVNVIDIVRRDDWRVLKI